MKGLLRLTILVMMTLCSLQMSYAASDPLTTLSLLEKLDTQDAQVVRIIVRYNSFDGLLEPAQSLQGRQALKLAQAELKQGMALGAAHVIEKVKDFEFVPMTAMQVNRPALLSLLSDPNITVFEDSFRRPFLAQSVPRVYPTRNTSEFHGDNQWAVAVLDSGVNKDHPNLSSKVISEACYSGGDGAFGLSSLCPDGSASSTAVDSGVACDIDGCGHGSMVAGIAAGNGPTQDGVARDANIISVQVFSELDDKDQCPGPDQSGCLVALTSDVIKGLERVYALRNSFDIAAVNLSLGSSEVFSGTCDDQPEKAIIDLLKDANIAVVVASGNAGMTSMMSAPACISSAIAVAATADDSDAPWSGNNTSTALDLFAPGINISTPALGSAFDEGTGTSFAAPHVAGALAVMRHAKPNMSMNQALNLLTKRGPVVEQNAISKRRLDVSAILNSLVPPPPPAPVDPRLVIAPIIMLLLE